MSISIARGADLPAGLVLATAVAIALDQAGIAIDTPELTALASFALLVAGLPHGSFDLERLRRSGAAGSRSASSLVLIVLYGGCAAATYLLWRLAPTLALGSFLVMAVAHFAEDWEDVGSRFIAGGIAAAIVSAPAVWHGDDLGGLFVQLTGDPDAAVLAELLLLVAPTASAVALIGLGLLWQSGHERLAVSAGCALAAMLCLPPVAGFALFFCLVHSPAQFRKHADALALRSFGQWRQIVVPISLGGLGVAVVVFMLNGGVSFAADVFASSFMTLAVLTVPHIVVPMIAGRFGRREAAIGV